MKQIVTGLLLTLLSSLAIADPLTAEAMEGKWLFSHMTLDGGEEMPVNMVMDFGSDGNVISYDDQDNERDRATYTVDESTIIYTDHRGVQNWDVIDFNGSALHVDHKGAEMFFVRP